MHAFGTLTTLALVLGAANATCFSGWSLDRNKMKGHIAGACDGQFQGTFSAGESKKICVDIEDNKGHLGSIDLEIKTPDASGGTISSKDCKHQLNKLVDNCLVAAGPLAYGGEDTVSGWYFKADANWEIC